MTAPTAAVRRLVKARDGGRCVSCGARDALEFQHRRAVGQGGSKVRPAVDDGLLACTVCNEGFEGVLHLRALVAGWKVRRWVQDPGLVPVWVWSERSWFVLTAEGGREQISGERAVVAMHAVYGMEVYEEWRSKL